MTVDGFQLKVGPLLPEAEMPLSDAGGRQGRSLAEIGEELDRSVAAVAGLIHRGLKKLRSELQTGE